MEARKAIALAFTGASGAVYGLRLLEVLRRVGEDVLLMVSPPARVVLATEVELNLPGSPKEMETALSRRYPGEGTLRVFGPAQWMAPVASGSNAPRAMVVCPCSMGTLAAIAQGHSRSLLERAADVAIKERRRLILVPRETPFSAIHLEHMLKLARLGVTILPANPGFYHRPQRLEELVDFVVARILDHLEVAHDLTQRWGEAD